jgi:hypothetical protein
VTGEPRAVAAELTRRYGKLFTRCVLHTPHELGPDVFAEIADGVRSGAGLRDESPAGAGS